MAKTAQGRLTLEAAPLELLLAQLGEELPRSRRPDNREGFFSENAGEGWKPQAWGPRILRHGGELSPWTCGWATLSL